MMAVLMFTVRITAKKHRFDLPAPDAKRPLGRDRVWSSKIRMGAHLPPDPFTASALPFHPTEQALSLWSTPLCWAFVYKELTWKNFLAALKDSFIDNGGIILIIAMSGIFGKALTIVNAPGLLTSFLFGLTSNPSIMMVLIVLLLVVLGMFIDSNVNIMLLTPLFLPLRKKWVWTPCTLAFA